MKMLESYDRLKAAVILKMFNKLMVLPSSKIWYLQTLDAAGTEEKSDQYLLAVCRE